MLGQEDKEEEREDGEITPEERLQKARDDRAAADQEIKARARLFWLGVPSTHMAAASAPFL